MTFIQKSPVKIINFIQPVYLCEKQEKNCLMKLYRFLFILIIPLIYTSCTSHRWDVDISNSSIDQSYKRFDQDLFSIPHDSIWAYVPILEKNYPRFFDLYNTQIIKIGGTNQLDYDKKLLYFLTDPDIEDCYEGI